MNDLVTHNIPSLYSEIKQQSDDIEFSMISDIRLGALLKTLVASKPEAHILELGTGVGLGLSWILEGADQDTTVISIDNDPNLIAIAEGYYSEDDRVELICQDGIIWLSDYDGEKFDLIFADTWPGKYESLDRALELLKDGGIYLIDDMVEQENWPEGHNKKVLSLINELESKDGYSMVKLNWSTGVIIMTKKKIA